MLSNFSHGQFELIGFKQIVARINKASIRERFFPCEVVVEHCLLESGSMDKGRPLFVVKIELARMDKCGVIKF